MLEIKSQWSFNLVIDLIHLRVSTFSQRSENTDLLTIDFIFQHRQGITDLNTNKWYQRKIILDYFHLCCCYLLLDDIPISGLLSIDYVFVVFYLLVQFKNLFPEMSNITVRNWFLYEIKYLFQNSCLGFSFFPFSSLSMDFLLALFINLKIWIWF